MTKTLIFHSVRKIVSVLVIFTFLVQSGLVQGAELALGAGAGVLPEPGIMVPTSAKFSPPILRGVKVNANDPFQFDFILENGDTKLDADAIKDESIHLIRYFLAALTVPEKDLWVNLSPYEKDRIITDEFGITEMGRDLLAEDYILKQITASVIYPDSETGKKFWNEVYQKAAEKYGTTDIPVDTFNKVWIVPEKAVVYEKGGAAYVSEAKLKVMLESDYLAASKSQSTGYQVQGPGIATANQELGKQIIREIVIPILEKDVNEGQNFAKLRQVYYSLVLAAWYKRKIKDSLLSAVYVDQKKVAGVNIDDPQMSEKIWAQYVEAFKKGAYNYIKEERDTLSGELIPRKYFSGGVDAMRIDATLDIKPMDNAMVGGLFSHMVDGFLRISVACNVADQVERTVQHLEKRTPLTRREVWNVEGALFEGWSLTGLVPQVNLKILKELMLLETVPGKPLRRSGRLSRALNSFFMTADSLRFGQVRKEMFDARYVSPEKVVAELKNDQYLTKNGRVLKERLGEDFKRKFPLYSESHFENIEAVLKRTRLTRLLTEKAALIKAQNEEKGIILGDQRANVLAGNRLVRLLFDSIKASNVILEENGSNFPKITGWLLDAIHLAGTNNDYLPDVLEGAKMFLADKKKYWPTLVLTMAESLGTWGQDPRNNVEDFIHLVGEVAPFLSAERIREELGLQLGYSQLQASDQDRMIESEMNRRLSLLGKAVILTKGNAYRLPDILQILDPDKDYFETVLMATAEALGELKRARGQGEDRSFAFKRLVLSFASLLKTFSKVKLKSSFQHLQSAILELKLDKDPWLLVEAIVAGRELVGPNGDYLETVPLTMGEVVQELSANDVAKFIWVLSYRDPETHRGVHSYLQGRSEDETNRAVFALGEYLSSLAQGVNEDALFEIRSKLANALGTEGSTFVFNALRKHDSAPGAADMTDAAMRTTSKMREMVNKIAKYFVPDENTVPGRAPDWAKRIFVETVLSKKAGLRGGDRFSEADLIDALKIFAEDRYDPTHFYRFDERSFTPVLTSLITGLRKAGKNAKYLLEILPKAKQAYLFDPYFFADAVEEWGRALGAMNLSDAIAYAKMMGSQTAEQAGITSVLVYQVGISETIAPSVARYVVEMEESKIPREIAMRSFMVARGAFGDDLNKLDLVYRVLRNALLRLQYGLDYDKTRVNLPVLSRAFENQEYFLNALVGVLYESYSRDPKDWGETRQVFRGNPRILVDRIIPALVAIAGNDKIGTGKKYLPYLFQLPPARGIIDVAHREKESKRIPETRAAMVKFIQSLNFLIPKDAPKKIDLLLDKALEKKTLLLQSQAVPPEDVRSFLEVKKIVEQKVAHIVAETYIIALREPVKSIEQQSDNAQGIKGGIDLNAVDQGLRVNSSDEAIRFNIDPAMFEQYRNVAGFVPVILNVQPFKDAPAFFGLSDSDSVAQPAA